MPRTARIIIPGYLYHITQRGNNRQRIFHVDNDYILYLKRIEEYRKKFEVDLFAYCLMRNHVHFILRPHHKDSFERMFRAVHMRYAQYFHKKTSGSGHVWQGRFYSCLLYGDHIKKAIRYVECNPVRANMVNKAWEYSWSSARAHLGQEYKWVTLANVKEVIEIKKWKEYLMEESDNKLVTDLRVATKKNSILGPKEFILQLEKKLNRKILPNPMGRPKREK